jgi:anti-sigma regulatory factor (Ser/Thr protein kinase)
VTPTVPTVELRFTPLPAHVRTARLVAAALARRAGIDESYIDEVKLAVGEACARAVGVNQPLGAEVVVGLTDDAGTFVVSVRDAGEHDETAAREAAEATDLADLLDLEGLGERGEPGEQGGRTLPAGFGLAVVAGLVDDLTVAAAPAGGTEVRMTWKPDTPTTAGIADR